MMIIVKLIITVIISIRILRSPDSMMIIMKLIVMVIIIIKMIIT